MIDYFCPFTDGILLIGGSEGVHAIEETTHQRLISTFSRSTRSIPRAGVKPWPSRFFRTRPISWPRPTGSLGRGWQNQYNTRACMQTHLKPNQDHGDSQHCGITISPFVVAGRHPAKLLQAVDQPLDLITLPIQLSIKRSGALFVLLSRDCQANASPSQVVSIFPGTISLIARDAPGPQTNATVLASPDRPLFQQPLGHRDLMLLARS